MSSQATELKPVPDFSIEAEERKFWQTHDTTEYVDWSKGRRVAFPNLKPGTHTIEHGSDRYPW